MKQNRILILVVLLLCIAAAALADSADELFAEAENAYQRGDLDDALELYKKLVVHYPDAPMVDRCLYRIGAIFIKIEDYPKARIYFDKLLTEHADSEFSKESLYYRGYCAYRAKSYLDAIADFTKYTSFASGTLRRGTAYLNMARSQSAQGQAGSALISYSNAWSELPEGADRDAAVFEAQKVAATIYEESILEGMLDRLKNGPVRDVVALELARRQVASDRRDKARGTLERGDFTLGPASIRLEAQRLNQATLPQTGGVRDVYIGCVLPLSGRFGLYGEQALKGLMLGIRAYDEPKIQDTVVHLLVRDSQGDAQIAVQAVRELVESDVVAIVGPLLSAESVKAAVEAQRLNVPLITLTRKEGITDLGEWIFRAFTTDQAQVDALVEFASGRRQAKRFAMLYPTDRYGQTMAEHFRQAAQERGLDLVIGIGYETTAVDWSRDIRDIKRAGEIDAIFIPDFSRSISMIVPQLYVLKQKPLLLGPSGWNDPHLAASISEDLQGCVIVDGFFEGAHRDETVAFLRKYKMHIGGKADLIAASAYDVGMIMDQILNRNPGADRSVVRELLLELEDFQGACGQTSFLPNGEISRPLFLITVGPQGLEQIR